MDKILISYIYFYIKQNAYPLLDVVFGFESWCTTISSKIQSTRCTLTKGLLGCLINAASNADSAALLSDSSPAALLSDSSPATLAKISLRPDKCLMPTHEGSYCPVLLGLMPSTSFRTLGIAPFLKHRCGASQMNLKYVSTRKPFSSRTISSASVVWTYRERAVRADNPPRTTMSCGDNTLTAIFKMQSLERSLVHSGRREMMQ